MDAVIRPVKESDSDALWQMMNALDIETKYMMYEPNERYKNTEEFHSAVRQAVEGKDLLLVAAADREIVGYIFAQRGHYHRIKHTAYIVVGVRRHYQNQGIGTRFFKELDRWAEQTGVTRLELTVMCPN